MSALYPDASESTPLPHFWRCIQYSDGNHTKARGRPEPLGRKKTARFTEIRYLKDLGIEYEAPETIEQ